MNLLSKADRDKIIEAYHKYQDVELSEMFGISEEDIKELRKKYNLKKQPSRLPIEVINYIKKNFDIDTQTLAAKFSKSEGCIRETKRKIIQGKIS